MDSSKFYDSSERIPMLPEFYGSTFAKPISVAPIPIDIANINGWFQLACIALGACRGSTDSLFYKRPRRSDKCFQKAFMETLDGNDTTPESKELGESLKKAQTNYDDSVSWLTSYFLSCAGKSDSLKRIIVKYPNNPELIVDELIRDHKKTSTNSAVRLKGKLFHIAIKGTCGQLIEEMETLQVEIIDAGGFTTDGEMASIALDQAKESDRYKAEVVSYMTKQYMEGLQPNWPAVKSFLIGLDRSTSDGTETALSAVTKLSTGPFCRECGVKHPYAQHLPGKNKATLKAAAALMRLNGGGDRSGGRFSSNGGRGASGNRFGGRFNGGRHGNRYEGRPGGGQSNGGRFSNNRQQYDNNRQQYNNNRQQYDTHQREPFSGNCDICSKPGHKAADCWSNPNREVDRSWSQSQREPFQQYNSDRQQPRRETQERAHSAVERHGRSDGYRFDNYDAVLERAKRSHTMYVCHHAFAALRPDLGNPFMCALDTGASAIFVRDSQHRLHPSRLINRTIATAGKGNLTSIREGYLGNMLVMGMSDDLQLQLCGAHALTRRGFLISIHCNGALLQRGADHIEIPWTNDILLFDLREIPDFVTAYQPETYEGSDAETPLDQVVG